MIVIRFFTITVIYCPWVSAANNLIDVSGPIQIINNQTRFYIDSTNNMESGQYNSVLWSEPMTESFILNSRFIHWFWFTLFNTTSDTLERYIYTDLLDLHYNYYRITGQDVLDLDPVNPSNRMLPVELKITLNPGDTLQILARYNYQWAGHFFPKFKNFKLYVSNFAESRKKLAQHEYADQATLTSNLIFLAIIFFLLLFTLFQFLIIREKVYLLYGFYLFSLFIYYFSKKTFLINFTPWFYFHQMAYVPTSILLIYSYTSFVENFLHIKERLPIVFKIFKLVNILLACILVIYMLCLTWGWGPYARAGYLYLRSGLIPVGIYTVYRIFMLKDVLSRFIIVGTGFILFLGLFSLANEFLNIIRPIVPGDKAFNEIMHLSYTQYGILLEILCFSLGLGYRTKMIQRHNLDLENKILRAQLNPHFIFNALNAIKSLVGLNKNQQAENYLVQFANLLREVLGFTEKEMITLDDELAFIKKYLSIENLRFNNELDIKWSIDPGLRLKHLLIPPLTLQPIVENALWHGLKNKSGHKILTIQIEKNDHQVDITVMDNGIGRQVASLNTSLHERDKVVYGLKITKERLMRGYPQAKIDTIDLKDDLGQATGTKVIISWPI